MNYLPTSCLIFFFFFFFSLLHPLPCASGKQEHGLCETSQFECGDITAGFPFWGRNRPEFCGHPSLQLNCDYKTNYTSLFISNQLYQVLDLHQKSNTLRLSKAYFPGFFCPSLLNTRTFPPQIFKLSPTYKSLTVFYHCEPFHPNLSSHNCYDIGLISESEKPEHHKTCYANFTVNVPVSFFPSEKKLDMASLESVVRRGFEVKVKIDENACQECLSSHESCGFNQSLPLEVKCVPSNPSHKGSFIINVPKSFVPEEKELNLTHLENALREGFEVKVKIDEKACRKCSSSQGICGFKNTTQVCCSKEASSLGCNTLHLPHDAGLSDGAKTGIGSASALVFLILLSGGFFCLISREREMQAAQYTRQDLPTTSYSSGKTSSNPTSSTICVSSFPRKTSDDLRKQNLTALIPLKHYSYTQVKRITKSFAEVVGKGGFGTVYKGTLCDGRSVAVKILKDSKGNGEDFINEVASMSKTSHVNIVSLLGFCSEGSKAAIIYEYLENGSLDQFISRKTSMNMDWMSLYGIALGVARGLEYLHHGCKTRIVHFDIKPQNILLDDNLCPKVSDFGLAKLCNKESILSLLDTRGTIGYIAPEVFSRMYGRVSHKSDVYSYGMLVLEMIGARNKERAEENSASNASSVYFPEWIYKDLEKEDNGRLNENGISSEEEEIAKKMTIVGLWCIQPSPIDRPSMNRVVEMMEGNLNALEVPPRPVLQQIPPSLLQESSRLSEDSQFTDKYVSLDVE